MNTTCQRGFSTLREVYLSSIDKYASRECFSLYEGERLTYAMFSERVDAIAWMLRSAGLRPGDKVALLSSNMPNWPAAYFAAVISGYVIVPVLPDFSGAETDMIIEHAEAKALLVSDKLFSKISKQTLDRLNIIIRTKNLGIISQNVHDEGETCVPAPGDLAAIIYTSGTTSKPKGVMLSHSNLASQVEMDYDLFTVYPDDIFLSILPLSHTYECSLGMLLPFMCGASVVYLDRLPSVTALAKALGIVRPTIMLSVPLIIEKLYKSKVSGPINKRRFLSRIYSRAFFRRKIHKYIGRRTAKMFGGRLRFFGIGGAKLDTDTELFLREGGFPYAIGYGLTETAPLIAGAIPGNVKFRSTGPVLSGVEARLENVNPQTGEGEIVVKSPSTMIGYYKNPAATAEVFTPDGWLRTKDLGRFDDDGHLFIMGRLGNMIVGPSGENIYPEEIESVINSHFLVNDSIVQEDDKGKLVALVHFNREELERRYQDYKEQLGTKMEEIKADIMRYVNSKVSRFSHISEVEEQPAEFEKTPTQKIKRFLYSNKNNTRKHGVR